MTSVYYFSNQRNKNKNKQKTGRRKGRGQILPPNRFVDIFWLKFYGVLDAEVGKSSIISETPFIFAKSWDVF